MMFHGKIFYALSALVLFSTNSDAQKKTVCYWYPGSSGMAVSSINVDICSHIIFSFLGLDSRGNIMYQSSYSLSAAINNLNQLRARSSSLNIVVSFGGAGASCPFASIASSASASSNFANNVYNFLAANNINGVDIDWEYPNADSDIGQKPQFVALLKTLKQKMGTRFTVSVALGAGQWRTELSYDIPGIFGTVDFVNLMTYDLHGIWEGKTGLDSAPFRGPLDDTAENVYDSVQLLLSYYGIDKTKIIVGIPTYGYAFTLTTNTKNGIGAPASSAPPAQPFRTICQLVKSGAYSYHWDYTQQAPYVVDGNLWIGYESVNSVASKADFINTYGLGGAMFWSLDDDDFDGICGGGTFPLITQVYLKLTGYIAPQATISTTTQVPTTSTTTTASTTSTTTTAPTTSTTTAPTTSTTTTAPSTSTTTAPTTSTTTTAPTTSTTTTASTTSTTTTAPTTSTTTAPTTSTTTTAPTTSTTTTAPTTSTTTTAPTTSTTTTAPTTFTCPSSSGYFTNPSSSSSFYQCANWIAYLQPCPATLHWNQNILTCM